MPLQNDGIDTDYPVVIRFKENSEMEIYYGHQEGHRISQLIRNLDSVAASTPPLLVCHSCGGRFKTKGILQAHSCNIPIFVMLLCLLAQF